MSTIEILTKELPTLYRRHFQSIEQMNPLHHVHERQLLTQLLITIYL